MTDFRKVDGVWQGVLSFAAAWLPVETTTNAEAAERPKATVPPVRPLAESVFPPRDRARPAA